MLKLNEHKAICALSSALDYVGVDDLFHGRRVGVMAAKIAEHMGWAKEDCLNVAHLGLLHDCGVSSSGEHQNLVLEMEWSGAKEHCERGYHYLLNCSLFENFAVPVRHHHDRWEELLTSSLDEGDRVLSNLIFLADRVDVLVAQISFGDPIHNPLILLKDKIMQEIADQKGTLFAPYLVDAFLEVGATDAFWFTREPEIMDDLLDDLAGAVEPLSISGQDVREFAQLVGVIIDAKSTFTQDHSVKVAALSRRMAEICGYDGDDLDDIEIAGLLHDAGKLRVPDELLDKKGPLNEYERALIRRHSFDSAHVLHHVIPDSRITRWVAMHHERWNGSGYPYSLKKDEIEQEAHILAVCDVFQALVQKRPYRESLSADVVLGMMKKQADNGAFDPTLIQVIADNLDEFHQISS